MTDNYENVRTYVMGPDDFGGTDEGSHYMAQDRITVSCKSCRRCDEAHGDGVTYAFIVCKTCGNKRCPKATDHRNACTGSNEPGQPGSAYGGLESDLPSRILVDGVDVTDKLHPNGRCECDGEGECLWCVRTERDEARAEVERLRLGWEQSCSADLDARRQLMSERDAHDATRTELAKLREENQERIVPRYEQIWISRSDYNELERHAGELERHAQEIEAELDQEREKVALLMQPVPETHGDFPWQMMRMWCLNYARDKQQWRVGHEELEKRCDELEHERKRFEGLYIESRSEHLDAELHAQELERQLLDLTAERDRAVRWLESDQKKLKTYRREIRRLQRALLVERGKGVGAEVERLGRIVRELQARVGALQSDIDREAM